MRYCNLITLKSGYKIASLEQFKTKKEAITASGLYYYDDFENRIKKIEVIELFK